MRSADRPLSPHLQIYRWQLTSVMSILHRASGVALGIGGVLLVWWLIVPLSFVWRRILLHDRLTKTRVIKVERILARAAGSK